MASLCFLTYEMFPVSPGGVGTLLAHSVRTLLERGHEVSVVLDLTKDRVEKFRTEHLPSYPRPEALEVYCLGELAAEHPCPRIPNRFQYKSVEFSRALEALRQRKRIDFAEFFEYTGIASEAVRRKRFEGAFADTVLAIRTHLSLDQIDAQEATKPMDIERYCIYRMEQFALRLADVILCPSQTWADDCVSRYGLHPERIRISPPCFVPTYDFESQVPEPDTVLFIGRQFQFKGVDLFVEAAVRMMQTTPEFKGRFVLCGYDSNESPVGGSFQEYLTRRIPASLRNRIEFAGQVGHDRLGQLAQRALCAVFPSYIESFCYAAHETYEAGVPVVVSDIPAFADFFKHEENCLKSTHTPEGFAECIRRVATDTELRDRLAGPRPPRPEALGQAYDDETIDAYRSRSRPECPPVSNDPQPAKVDVLITLPIQGAAGWESDPDCRATLDSLASAGGVALTKWLLPLGTPEDLEAGRAVALLGGERSVYRLDHTDNVSMTKGTLTGDAVILLEAGDTVDPTFWDRATALLARPDVAFVTAWRRLREYGQGMPDVDAYAFDWLTWEYPILAGCVPMRALFSVAPPLSVAELFDVRAGEHGEWHRLAKRLRDGKQAYTIPQPLLTIKNNAARWGRAQQRPFVYHHLTRNEPMGTDLFLVSLLNEWRLGAAAATSDGSTQAASTEEAYRQRIARLEAELAWLKGSRVLKLARRVGLGPLAKPPRFP